MHKAAFTPENAAMLLIDHQVGTMAWTHSHDINLVKQNLLKLARIAKPPDKIGRSDVKLGLPVSKPAPASGARNELPTLCSMKGHGGEAAIGGSSRRPATSSYPLWTMRYFVIGGAPLEQSSVAWEPERVKSVESQKFTSISSGL